MAEGESFSLKRFNGALEKGSDPMAEKKTQPKGAFIVVEGLIGSGKSTVAKELAGELDLEYMVTLPAEFKATFDLLENDPAMLEARHALFFSSLCRVAKIINEKIEQGEMVIIDSWIYRTQATHSALGSTLNLKPPTWFPQPDVKLLLTCSDEIRLSRVAARGRESGYWKSRCEEKSEEILDWYRKNVKGLVEVNVDRDLALIRGELISKVRPTVRKKRELMKAKEGPASRKFLIADLEALDADIVQNQAHIKEAKDMGQEATEQSSESWHDNYNFEESQRQLKMHMNNLGRLSNMREKAEVVTPVEDPLSVEVGTHVHYTIVGAEGVESVHVGSFAVGEVNRAKGFISYDAPRVAGLIGGKRGDTRTIRLDAGDTPVVIVDIKRSELI